MKKLTGLAVIGLILSMGCVSDPQEELSDSQNIQDLLQSSSLVRMDPLDGQGAQGGKDSRMPEYWWRELTTEGDMDIFLENDPATGVCTVSVSRTLLANFNIDVVHDGILDPGIKPISDVRTRRLIVRKTGDASDPHGGWELTHITPAVFSLNSSIQQEVFVSSMKIYKDDELIWECSNPDTFYSVDDELPHFQAGDQITVEAEVVHTNPVYDPPLYVFVHGPCPTWPRHWMNDNGTLGDKVAGDGIYTYQWCAEETSEHWFIAVDVIDADTMMDQDEDDYDSGAWGILALDE